MNPTLNDRDLEVLSTYLDNQLPEVEKARLEQRLSAEPELRQALAGLRATVQAVRSLPKVRVPRNFTLDPTIHATRRGGQSIWSGFGVMRLATGLATVLFVFSVAGDFLTRSQFAARAIPEAAIAPASTAGLDTGTPAAEAGPADLFLLTATESIASADLAEPEAPPAAEALPESGGGGLGGGEEGGVGGGGLDASQSGPTAEAALMAAEATETVAEQTGRAAAGSSPEVAVTPELTPKTTADEIETPAALAQVVATEPAPALAQPGALVVPAASTWLRAAQVLFGLLAVGLGLATLRLRSRS